MARQRRTGIGGVSDLREALASLIDPLVLLTRERIDDALQDAVSRGRVTADDAHELATTLIERGRRQTNDVLGELEHLLAAKAGRAKRAAGVRSQVGKAARKTAANASTGKPKSTGGPGIAGYDDLNAKQVQQRLAKLTPAKLRQLRDYERAHANRKTVLAAIERRLK